jgi:hypothetical protein
MERQQIESNDVGASADSATRVSGDALTSALSNVKDSAMGISTVQTRTSHECMTSSQASLQEVTNLAYTEPSRAADDHGLHRRMVSMSLEREEDGGKSKMVEGQHRSGHEEQSESSAARDSSDSSESPSPAFAQCLSFHDLAFIVNRVQGGASNPTVSWGKRFLNPSTTAELEMLDNYALLCVTEGGENDVAALTTYSTSDMLYIIVAKNRALTTGERRYMAEMRRLLLTSRNGANDGGTLKERMDKKFELIFRYCKASICTRVYKLLAGLELLRFPDLKIESQEVRAMLVKEAHRFFPWTIGLSEGLCIMCLFETWKDDLALRNLNRRWALASHIASRLAAIPGIGDERFMKVQAFGVTVHQAICEYARFWEAVQQLEFDISYGMSAKQDISILEVLSAPPQREGPPKNVDIIKVLNQWSRDNPPTPRRDFTAEDIFNGWAKWLCQAAWDETNAHVHPACSLALYLVEHGMLHGNVKLGLSNSTVCWFCYRYLDVLQELTFRLPRPAAFFVSNFNREMYSPDWLTCEQTSGNLIAGRALPIKSLQQPLPMECEMFKSFSFEMIELRRRILKHPDWSDASDTKPVEDAEDANRDNSTERKHFVPPLAHMYKLGRKSWCELELQYRANRYSEDGHTSSFNITAPIKRILYDEDPSDAYEL